MQRSLTVTGLCLGILASLAACASVPREQAAQLAKSGAEASDLAARDIQDLSARVGRQVELRAFADTWETCTDPGGAPCTQTIPSAENQKESLDLIRVINLRANALTALGDAYRSLGQEASYDAEGALEPVVDRLATSVNSYAAVFRAGPEPLLSAPITGVITQTAGLIARDRQRARLIAGSGKIREAVVLLREALAHEVRTYGPLSNIFAQQENATVEALFEAHLIARAPVLQPMADDLGVTLVPGAEEVLASNDDARTAVLALLSARASGQGYRQAARYAAILTALDTLAEAHRSFEAQGAADMADLNRAIADITALIPAPKEAAQ